MRLLPLSVVVATKDRPSCLGKMLASLWAQEAVPSEVVVVDASTKQALGDRPSSEFGRAPQGVVVKHLLSTASGSAAQRNEGVLASSQPVLGFMDDDIQFEPACIERLWAALHAAPEVGGANAMIMNQQYHEPGVASRVVYRLLGGVGPDYAGQIFGPAVNLLPADREGMPEVVPVGWLNTTCTIYRREALPNPPFASFFTGYSMMEDAALSLVVSRRWKLLNARTARIHHDSQAGEHKADPAEIACMAVVNRDFVARRILGRKGLRYWLELAIWGAFQFAATAPAARRSGKSRAALKGTLRGYFNVITGNTLPETLNQ